MVSAGIKNTPISSVDSSEKVSANEKSKQVNDDFTKILENHSDSRMSKTDTQEMKDNSSKNDKIKEIIQKAFSGEKKELKEASKDIISEPSVLEEAIIIISEIINVIADNLNVSCEEVKEALGNLQISTEDMLSLKNINELICELTEMDNPMDILTNTQLSKAVKEIYSRIDEAVTEMKTDFDLSDEELKDVFAKIEMPDIDLSKQNVKTIGSEEVSVETDEVNTNKIHVVAENEGTESRSENENRGDNSGVSDKGTNNPVTGEIKSKNKNTEELVIPENNFNDIVSNIKEKISGQLGTQDESVSDRIIRQITDDIKMHVSSNTTSLEIQLEPESLGRVSLVVASKAGSVTVQLTVQNEVAKEAIESQIAQLKENLDNQGLKVEAVEVTIASKEFEENLDKGNNQSDQKDEKGNRRRISEDELAQINGISMEKEESEDMIKEMGNTTVSYTA